MYDRPDQPGFTAGALSLRSIGRRAGAENRAVLLDAAGRACGHLSSASVALAVLFGAQGRRLRTAADLIDVDDRASDGTWQVDRPGPKQDLDARAQAMYRHPSNFRRRSGL